MQVFMMRVLLVLINARIMVAPRRYAAIDTRYPAVLFH